MANTTAAPVSRTLVSLPTIAVLCFGETDQKSAILLMPWIKRFIPSQTRSHMHYS